MESLSSVATIVRLAQDIAGAVATVSRNRSRCRKLAERVQCIGDLLRELHGSEAEGARTTDAATRSLLGRLEDALHRALQLVRSCRGSSWPRSFLAGGWRAERFDEVDGEIDRCLLDLGVANRILIARLEKLLLHQEKYDGVPTPAKKYDGGGDRKDTGVKNDCAKDDDRKIEKVAADKTAVAAGAGNATIGVPVRTVSAGMHKLVPPPSHGHWTYAQGIGTGGCYHDGAGAPSNAAAYYHHHHSLPYPDMFSEENPNACSII